MNKHNHFILAFLFLLISSLSAQERNNLFDNHWKFSLSDKSEYRQPNFNDAGWRQLDLPHDWSIEGKTDLNNPMKGAGGYFPAGIGWYRKSFNAPASWQSKKVSIYFEGVYMNSEVFINGKSLGIHPYGFTSFSYDLTPFLLNGKNNVLAVRVDNSQQINCRWYSGSGIYRHVWMQVTDPVHIAQWGVDITTPKISEAKATVLVKTLIKNETSADQKLVLTTALRSPNQKAVGSGTSTLIIQPNSEQWISQSIQVNRPALWSPESPALYRAISTVSVAGKTLDKSIQSFGIRSIAYSAEKGFLLNGKSIKLNGGCVHHDHGCLGAASFDRAEERKVELLKAAGFNTVRTSHNPPAEAFLRACDRLGLLVIDEAFDGWRTEKNKNDYARFFDTWAKRDIQSMVARDRNHPSIVMWSIGNEIIERTKPEAVQTAKSLSGYVKELDKTRPVTSAMTTWNEGWAVFDSLMAAHDICGYNYQLHEAPKDHERAPNRVIVQTESYPREPFKNWRAVQTQAYVIGDIVWTAQDYLGESGIGRWYYPGEPKGEHWERDFFPWHGAYCGDIDLTGWRKPISHYRNLLWNKTERLYLAVKEPNPDKDSIHETMWSVWPTWESWTWPGSEGKPLEVEVYSNYPTIKLYLNNQLMAEKATNLATEFKATIPVNYQAGELKVVGIDKDGKTETRLLQTAKTTAQIKLTADRKVLQANGQDLSYVTVELTDAAGCLNPNAENTLHFQVEGAGSIIGVDNALLTDTALYQSNARKAWKGRAMIVIRSSHKAGIVRLKVSADGFAGSQLIIAAK